MHGGRAFSASFSPDGTRILTGSDDETAKVWDARTGTHLLDLKGHRSSVSVYSAAFSPDGTRIVTVAGGEGPVEAKIWDARTGRHLLDLKGYAGSIGSASAWFTPDGTRIVIDGDVRPAPTWDAQTGQELKGEPTAPPPPPDNISPDGRWIAYIIGDRVELIPLQPDEEELSYRRIMMQPNYGLYREAYDAATKANDEFAARFYLNLFPPPEQVLIRAEAIVAPLFDRLLLREDVLAALKAQPESDPEIMLSLPETGRDPGPNPPRSATVRVGIWFAILGDRKRLTSAACASLRPLAGSSLKTAFTSTPWAWPSTDAGSWPRRWQP